MNFDEIYTRMEHSLLIPCTKLKSSLRYQLIIARCFGSFFNENTTKDQKLASTLVEE
jgi:hypothetical protein